MESSALTGNYLVQTKEQKREVGKAWYLKNRDSILAKNREEYRRDPSKKRAANDKYKLNNREKVLSYKRKDSSNPKRRLTRCRTTARQKGLTFNIDLTWYKEYLKNPCYYCGGDLQCETGHSLDRIDNTLGYEHSNVLPCCGDCNKLRGDRLTVDETKVAVEAILTYRKQLDETKQGEASQRQTRGRPSPN